MPYLPQKDMGTRTLLSNTHLLGGYEQLIGENLKALRAGATSTEDVSVIIGAFLAKLVGEMGLPSGSLHSPTLIQSAVGEARRLSMKQSK